MKSKRILLTIVVCILALSVITSYAETKKLKQIGRYTLVRIKGDVPTSEVMKTLVDRYAGDIKYGFDMAGYGDLFLPFLEQLKDESFKESVLEIGDKLVWMLFRSHGAGKKPIPIFSFIVKKDYKQYEIIMPRACGNISLRKVEEVIPPAICDIVVDPIKANINDPISVDMSGSQHAKLMEVEVVGPDGTIISTKSLTPESPKWQTKLSDPGEYVFSAKVTNFEGKISAEPCEAKTYINFPPICKLWTSCLLCENFVGRPITCDASNSTDPDGEIVKAYFEIKDLEGNVIDTYSDTSIPFAWEKIFEIPGSYSITAVVTDDFGAISKPENIEIEVTQKKMFFLAETGPFLARGSHGPFAGARLGVMYKLIPDTLDFVVSGGGSLALKDEPWTSFFMANVLMNVHTGPVFFGAGAGFTTKVKESRKADAEIIGNVGFDLFNNYTLAGQLLFETRIPIGEGRSFADNHKLFFGFRLLF